MIKPSYILLFCLPLLLACQSKQHLEAKRILPQINLYQDSQFQPQHPIHIETEQEIFQLDDEMRFMVKAKLKNNLPAYKKANILLEHIFNEENISLTYNSNANVTARSAYHNKLANCISLTILAYALADEADMNISFQQVDVPEYWVRNGQYSLLTGHVNLLVIERDARSQGIAFGSKITRIDFDPFVSKRNFPSKVISKQTLLAMFYNNKGAEAMVSNNYTVAYQYLKLATQVDNQFSSAWGNLGILYKLSGYYDMAEKAYRHAILVDEDNLTSLANLALLLNKQGRFNEAEPLEVLIHKTRVKNPYYHALLANEAYFNQSYDQALRHYKKAIQLDDEQHEFFLGLAKTYYMQNNFKLAKRSMKKAITLTKTKDTENLYVAKLNFLKYQQTAD